MLKLSHRRYRHIVFTDTMDYARRAVDLTPPALDALGERTTIHAASASSAAADDPNAAAQLSLEESAFVRWLFERRSIALSSYRPETLARRLPACLRTLRATSVSNARATVERNHALIDPAVSSLIIGVTSFFRDAPVFAYLREVVLPHVSARQGARIWSVGCSDGAELYSVAIELAEMRTLHRCQLLGSDCRAEATRAAALGQYHASMIRSVPGTIRTTYFECGSEPDSYVVRPFLRASLQWRTADAVHVPEPGPWDVILCRNMAMYLRGESSGRLWQALQAALRPGGYLVLGKAERPHGVTCLNAVAPCIYRRAGA